MWSAHGGVAAGFLFSFGHLLFVVPGGQELHERASSSKGFVLVEPTSYGVSQGRRLNRAMSAALLELSSGDIVS